jgi:hypothetical protein
MTHVTVDRYPDRPLDERGTRHDICPYCGGDRDELLIAPDLFYCEPCKRSTLGPNSIPPEQPPEQMTMLGAPPAAEDDGPPIDEGMAWMADEMPDE